MYNINGMRFEACKRTSGRRGRYLQSSKAVANFGGCVATVLGHLVHWYGSVGEFHLVAVFADIPHQQYNSGKLLKIRGDFYDCSVFCDRLLLPSILIILICSSHVLAYYYYYYYYEY